VRAGIKPPGNISKPESIEKWFAENAETATNEAVAKTSFDPAAGHIACIAWAIDDRPARSLSVTSVDQEAEILSAFFDEINESCGMNMARWIGHYITGFDLRFIINRAIILGVKLPPSVILPRDPKSWSDQVFDTMVAWAGARGTISQDKLAKALGMAGKGGFDGSMVAEAWANGEYKKIADYCMDEDVETVRAMYKRFQAVGY
jgi:DNA polymerase elongation subunit (family B)